MCQFFKKRGYPDSAVTTGKHRAQEIDRETALQTSQNEETDRITFTLTYHPQNLAIKNVILKNFKILRNDLGNFFVRSAFKFNDQPGTFTCNRTRCKTGETERRLADRFREHLRDAEQNNTDAPKPVARHFNLPNHSHHNMTVYGLSLHHGNTESSKNLEQKFIFQLGTLSPHGINERLSFH